MTGTNPNNCDTCYFRQVEHDQNAVQFCYMFKNPPTDICGQHTKPPHLRNMGVMALFSQDGSFCDEQ